MRTLIEQANLTIDFDDILKIKDYLNARVKELEKLANDENHKNPCVFMGISAIFDLLSNLPYSDGQMRHWNNRTTERYKKFLKDYVFDLIQNSYEIRLNEAFYHRVRCGLDHAFSTGANHINYRVVLSHENDSDPEEVNLQNIDGSIDNGIIFTALGMIKLLKHSIDKIFDEVDNGHIIQTQIITRFRAKKPLSRFYI